MALENNVVNESIDLRNIGEGINRSYNKTKKVYQAPKYKLIKPLFGKSYTTTVSAVSLKR